MSNSVHKEEKLKKAKALYMQYISRNAIAEKAGIPASTVYHHIKTKWRDERELMKAELIAQMTESKKANFTKMTSASIEILQRALTTLAKRGEAPTMQEACKVSEIMSTLDRITRLDDGDPTDIISNQEKPLTIEVLKEKIAKDPFEAVEYKELKIEKDKEESGE